MDRKAWIAVVLCFLGLFGWQWWYGRKHNEQMAEYRKALEAAKLAEAQAAASAVASPAPATVTAARPEAAISATPAPAAPAAAPAVVPESAPPAPERRELVATEAADYTFTTHGAGIAEVALNRHALDGGLVRLNSGRPVPIGALSFLADAPDLGPYESTVGPDGVTFVRTYPDGLRVEKRFQTSGEGLGDHLVAVQIRFENAGTATVERAAWSLHLGAAAPVHARDLPTYTGLNWHQADHKSKFIDANWFREGRFLGFQTRAARGLYSADVERLQWAGVKNQYFTTILTLAEPVNAKVSARPFDVKLAGEERLLPALEGVLTLPGFRLEPGARSESKFTLYSGPKEHRRLAKLGADQDEVLNYGMFKPFSLALLWGMNTLKGFLGNYAVAILVLTIIIKTGLWPLQNVATKSMRKMAALSPKITELREKYKDDPTRMNQEMMKLYKDYGINPFGGCLPMLIQIPIFFGFYSMLGTAVELRNSHFLWVNDLSQPDTVFHLGPFPVNILPLLMAATMLWQMSLTPKTGDAVQQRIFMFMPLIFIVFCYNFASALSLYWTAQNLFSVVQLYLTRNQPIPALTKVAQPDPRARKGKPRR